MGEANEKQILEECIKLLQFENGQAYGERFLGAVFVSGRLETARRSNRMMSEPFS